MPTRFLHRVVPLRPWCHEYLPKCESTVSRRPTIIKNRESSRASGKLSRYEYPTSTAAKRASLTASGRLIFAATRSDRNLTRWKGSPRQLDAGKELRDDLSLIQQMLHADSVVPRRIEHRVHDGVAELRKVQYLRHEQGAGVVSEPSGPSVHKERDEP